MTDARTTPMFRWSGQYWSYLVDGRLHDRHGRQVGWLTPTADGVIDVYHLGGHCLGELTDGHYVLRGILRTEPVHRATVPAIPHMTPPDPVPNRDPRDPREGWADALPWPLAPPDPPRH
jgi:hypothetical protein